MAAGVLDSVPILIMLVATRRATGSRLRLRGVGILAWDGLYTVGLTATRGRTFGQQAFGIRVVDRSTGARPSWRQSAARWATSALLPLPPGLLPTPASLVALRELQPEINRIRQSAGETARRSRRR